MDGKVVILAISSVVESNSVDGDQEALPAEF